jgi:hypothetical protein
VWLDERAQDASASSHALDWASRLHLPLRIADTRGEQLGVAIQQFLRAGELCVFANEMPRRVKEEILFRSARSPSASLLVCPQGWQPMRRPLVLNEARRAGSRFMEFVGHICRAFDVAPTVLTIAGTEENARSSQKLASQILAAIPKSPDFDFLVGRDTNSAVALAARCRRCTHVLLERHTPALWSRWFKGDQFARLLDLPESLAFLAIPPLATLAQVPVSAPSINGARELADGLATERSPG